MLLIKVELHPWGDASRAREIARMRIYNDGTGTPARGNYKADVYIAGTQDARPDALFPHGKPTRHAELKDYPRRLHVWNLVARMLAKLEYK